MRLLAITTAALVAAVVVFAAFTLPPAPRATGMPLDAALAARTMKGAFHVHSTDSDGRADRAAIAAAARRAGLQFVIFTDHGDGTAPHRDPGYVDGVLSVDGVEISTNAGHYIAMGLGPVPYRLGGDAPAVVEDVQRLGGVGVIAHPDSARSSLAWHDWTVRADAVEWLNGDSEWRNESRARLARLMLHYLVRPPAALAEMLDRTADVTSRWSEATARFPLTAVAGHDAHGGLGGFAEQGSRSTSGVPSYEAMFRTFSTHVVLDGPPTGDAGRDAAALVDAFRRGRVYTVIDGLATPGGLEFRAQRNGVVAGMGESLTGGGAVAFSARLAAPPGTRVSLIRNGREVAFATGETLTAEAAEAGAYHIEAALPGDAGRLPWILGNPIYVDLPPAPALDQSPAPARSVSLMAADWRVEKDAASDAILAAGPAMSFRLREGVEASQFVALVAPVSEPRFDSLFLDLVAERPMRISVQLRTGDGAGRWRRSVYVPPDGRPVSLPIDSFVPAEPGIPSLPDAKLIKSVLLVVDLTNAVPGSRGRIQVRAAQLTSGH